MRKGFIHIYTGNGKGKTTAAFGLALRASGHDLKTYIGQFMKGQKYGEVTSLIGNDSIFIEQYGDINCIRKEDVEEKHIIQAEKGLKKAKEAMLSANYDIIVLDEILVTHFFSLLTTESILSFISIKPENTELIMTGRYAPKELIQKADLVTEMQEIKHYYSKGVIARDGIER